MDTQELRMIEIPKKGWDDIKHRTAQAAADIKVIESYLACIIANLDEPEAQEQKQDLNEVFDMLEVQHRTLLDLFMREAYIQTMDS